MSLPKVSIIVPCLNMLDLTKQTVESIAKTCDVGFEILLINNASTDQTKEWLDTLAEPLLKQNPNFVKLIVVHNKENKFISGGINIGMLHSSAPYMSIIANDVIIPPKMFSWAIKELEKNPKIGTISPYTTEDERFKGVDNFYANYDKIPKQDKWAINWHQSICQVFTREMWEKVGEWDERLRTHLMDNCAGLRIYFAGYSPTAWEGIVAYHQRGSMGRAQMAKESEVAKQDSRYYLKKWGVFPDKPHTEIPECIQERAKEGQYLSSGQLSFKNKIRKTQMREPGHRIN